VKVKSPGVEETQEVFNKKSGRESKFEEERATNPSPKDTKGGPGTLEVAVGLKEKYPMNQMCHRAQGHWRKKKGVHREKINGGNYRLQVKKGGKERSGTGTPKTSGTGGRLLFGGLVLFEGATSKHGIG